MKKYNLLHIPSGRLWCIDFNTTYFHIKDMLTSCNRIIFSSDLSFAGIYNEQSNKKYNFYFVADGGTLPTNAVYILFRIEEFEIIEYAEQDIHV